MTYDLEAWFKVSAHHLPKGSLWVKYESYRAKGKEDMPRERDLGRTDGWKDGPTDKLTTIGRPQSGALINAFVLS